MSSGRVCFKQADRQKGNWGLILPSHFLINSKEQLPFSVSGSLITKNSPLVDTFFFFSIIEGVIACERHQTGSENGSSGIEGGGDKFLRILKINTKYFVAI